MEKYDPAVIEPKWSKKWAGLGIYQAEDFSAKEKKYVLVEFPYPSGAGLHVGHTWGYTMGDVVARHGRMNGQNVLFPMGWDAFGLPAENYAIKTGIHPQLITAENVANFRKQMDQMGFSFDWSREVNTTDPAYYKWTQWIFLQLFKQGLAYKQEMPINWCPFCKVGLALEEVTNENTHERCGNKVTKKMVAQWMLKITAYADRLIEDLATVDYSDDIKHQQINWIGRSEGARIRFPLPKLTSSISERSGQADQYIEVFTTRPDTLPGATYLVLAPEHEQLAGLVTKQQQNEIDKYKKSALEKSELERTELQKDKTGVFTGAYAINPLNQQKIPIWASDYVLVSYGTGAIMGVPAHDERDREFAEKYDLPIVEVKELGLEVSNEIVTKLSKESWAEKAVEYKLRDWIFSRQHYWGEPIPIIHCEKCGIVPVPEEQLPVELPELDDFEPTEDGRSPLAKVREWVEVECPNCGGLAERETDTMPNWAGSSWYFLRYCDAQNDQVFADRKKLDYYLPVDLYLGGAEHTTLHVLYSRFWHKFLFDQELVRDPEPYGKRRNRGLLLGLDGRRMSKSRGNVINPDDEVEKFGADTLRVYELFIGPFQGTFPWDPKAERGIYRFLEKVWRVTSQVAKSGTERSDGKVLTKLHQTIKKVGEDIEELKFNTAIAAMMELVNEVISHKPLVISKEDWEKFLVILAPFAPFITEELWQEFYADPEDSFVSVHQQPWPEFDPELIAEETITIPVQVNGKVRGILEVESGEPSTRAHFVVTQWNQAEGLKIESEILARAKKLPNVAKHIADKKIVKEIYVEGKMVNFVID